MKHIVIVGAGFAGVRLARNMRKYHKQAMITIINDTPDFRYSPALYRAAAGFKLGTARLPLEWMLLDSPNTKLVIGEVTNVNALTKRVVLSDGTAVSYDYVVFALGAITTYFNIEGLAERAYGIKSVEEVEALKQHLHESIINKQVKEHNLVIVGAGPTGVELSSALGSYAKLVSKQHRISRNSVSIYLVEASPRILPQMSERAAHVTKKRLMKLGVNILTDTRVETETANQVVTSSGRIHTHSVIWTAGTTNNPFFAQHPDIFKRSPRGRIVVNKHLQAKPSIYVIGDNAETPHSGLALTAIRHADYVAKDLYARIDGKKRAVFGPRTPIQIVPAGEGWAVLQYGRVVLKGRLIGLLRKIADIVGYTDVLGPIKALTIWSSSDRQDAYCDTCRR